MTTPEHVETVVVGSGFGGSVTAYRLAKDGRPVCVLERGKAYPPGSFARRPVDMAANFWDPSEGMHGLYNVWHFKGIESLVSSGLGGGSLIYANVLLRKPEHTFHGAVHWPVDRATLDPHYEAVEQMMNVQSFPMDAPGFRTPKTVAMQEAATKLDDTPWQLPPLAVTFANHGQPPAIGQPIPAPDYGNIHGLPRQTCRLCGECDVGCNYGSKNTLDHTYLSAARHHGADVRTLHEVRTFEARPGGGFTVQYVKHDPEADGPRYRPEPRTMTCDRLVLAAGTFGTTILLLRNKAFRNAHPALGSRFSGNGDLLTFALKSRQRVLNASHGPVITSTMHVTDQGQEFWVQDAGFPGFVDWMLETTTVPPKAVRSFKLALRLLWARITRNPESDLSAEIGHLIEDTDLSSRSLPLLGMGLDVPDGRMKLNRKGTLVNDWTAKTSQEYFDAVRGHMQKMAASWDAHFVDNPLWWVKRVITVHPLGGAPMGRNDHEGVVDQWGQAFHQPGLFVADGAALPGPTGPNPSLTIAAFADRMAERILEGATP